MKKLSNINIGIKGDIDNHIKDFIYPFLDSTCRLKLNSSSAQNDVNIFYITPLSNLVELLPELITSLYDNPKGTIMFVKKKLLGHTFSTEYYKSVTKIAGRVFEKDGHSILNDGAFLLQTLSEINVGKLRTERLDNTETLINEIMTHLRMNKSEDIFANKSAAFNIRKIVFKYITKDANTEGTL